jgi:NTE family protein
MPTTDAQFLTDEDSGLGPRFASPKYDPDGVGLALSGGGYKAAAYHLGGLIRLNEMGWLKRIDRISSVSGGSIAAGLLGLKWKALTFDAAGVATNFDAEVAAPLRKFLLEANLDVGSALLGLFNPFRSGGDEVASRYAKHLFGKATLQDLPAEGEGPRFVIVATNYELNSLWRFSRPYAADYRVGRIDRPCFSLARIVAASSAFPPVFCPLTLDLAGHTLQSAGGAPPGARAKRALLADGGIYDNMGLEPIWKRYGTLLVSNAGDNFDEVDHPTDWLGLMRRIISMMHRQAENNRQRQLMMLAAYKDRKVAYWPLRNDGSNYPVNDGPPVPADDVAGAQTVKVRLWSLGPKPFAQLANHGYSLCDRAMRSYLDPGAAPASKLPY